MTNDELPEATRQAGGDSPPSSAPRRDWTVHYEPFDWYETPLYYDIIFDTETDQEADFLAAVHERHGKTRGRRVLEPACGSGRLVSAMLDRGWNVTGFDASDGMLRFARERTRSSARRPRLVHARMESFDIAGPFDLAHCLVSTFKYLSTEDHARAHLERVAAALRPGGVYVLGVHLTDYADRGVNRERWVGRRGGVEVVCNIQGWPADRRARRERVRSRLVVREDGAERGYETNWHFRTYGFRQLRSLLASVPALEHVATYDFSHDIEAPIPFDGAQMDNVLVLKKGLRD